MTAKSYPLFGMPGDVVATMSSKREAGAQSMSSVLGLGKPKESFAAWTV